MVTSELSTRQTALPWTSPLSHYPFPNAGLISGRKEETLASVDTTTGLPGLDWTDAKAIILSPVTKATATNVLSSLGVKGRSRNTHTRTSPGDPLNAHVTLRPGTHKAGC